MLKVRSTQFDALEAAQVQVAHDVVVNLFWRRRDEFTGELNLDYIDGLATLAVEQCRLLDFDRCATWIGVTASLLKDDVHPMSLDRRDEKIKLIFQELAGQSLFANLRARAAAAAKSAPARSGSD